LASASATRWGLPCCISSRCGRAVATTPVEPLGARRSLPQQCQLSLCNRQVSLHIAVFGACSAFTRVTARTLAESLTDPFHRRLQTVRCLPSASIATGRSDPCREGFPPSQEPCLPRHTITPSANPPYALRNIVLLYGPISTFSHGHPPGLRAKHKASSVRCHFGCSERSADRAKRYPEFRRRRSPDDAVASSGLRRCHSHRFAT